MECKRGFRLLLERVEKDVSSVVGTDPFQFWGAFIQLYKAGDVCEHCYAMIGERNRERRAVWDRLPEIMGIAKPDAEGAEVGGDTTNTYGPISRGAFARYVKLLIGATSTSHSLCRRSFLQWNFKAEFHPKVYSRQHVQLIDRDRRKYAGVLASYTRQGYIRQ